MGAARRITTSHEIIGHGANAIRLKVAFKFNVVGLSATNLTGASPKPPVPVRAIPATRLGAEAVIEVAVEPFLIPRPMAELMQGRGEVVRGHR
jgi:hypothetical protein